MLLGFLSWELKTVWGINNFYQGHFMHPCTSDVIPTAYHHNWKISLRLMDHSSSMARFQLSLTRISIAMANWNTQKETVHLRTMRLDWKIGLINGRFRIILRNRWLQPYMLMWRIETAGCPLYCMATLQILRGKCYQGPKNVRGFNQHSEVYKQ